MFRNQYDSDVSMWSPQGRLFQVEYAMEAVTMGTAIVGLKSDKFAILAALSKQHEETGTTQLKIIEVDTHIGISFAGITSDARVLSQHLRTECLSYMHSYSSKYPVQRLVTNFGKLLQKNTQHYSRRPFGVGLLLAGYDEKGPHIYQIMPSANCFNCKSMAIGARSQGARTYLMQNQNSFATSSKSEIICHGINALKATIPVDTKLDLSIAIVGEDQPFKVLSNEECLEYQDICAVKD
ncbi:hypothetical protein KR093_003281, partial [Drosophila rubida]